MRTPSELDELITETVRQSAGAAPFGILATSPAEAELIRARMKGRRGVAHLDVVLGSPEDLIPLMDRVR